MFRVLCVPYQRKDKFWLNRITKYLSCDIYYYSPVCVSYVCILGFE